ncbi:MFS general substrate transporter [Microthyrium microscopicum]|uniref:MFS general substrate transporter n=1 Tax=Microthyrium microscopicum TaxID=703497 RepID=A0A6A6UE23_9PEZI|nr:MFS general substrate transporter [Microthyrium microscopicum]
MDLKDQNEKLAYEEGHDADISTNIRAGTRHSDEEKGSITPNISVGTDPNEVWWDEPENMDPHNPMNWSSQKKWGQIAVLSYVTLITPLASSMFAPGVPDVIKDFGITNELLATFVVSIYLLGFAFGPLVIAPLSEIYGRYWLYNVCNVLFVVFAVACGLAKNMGQLVAFRFIHGIFGVCPLTIGGGTIADMMPVEKRGGAMAIWAIGPLLGPVFGPVAGGYLVEAKGWRWSFWLLAILSGVGTVAGFFFSRETYAPVILEHKAARLRKETANPDLRSRLASDVPMKQVFLRAIVRPTKMLFLSPIVTLTCMYVAVAYGILYLLFTTFTFVFQENYGFSTGAVGLVFIPLGIGMMLSLGIMGTVTDKIIKGKQARGEEVVPEDRIPIWVITPAACLLPVGLFIYGWTTQYKVHWIAPLIGTACTGFALLVIFMSMQTYIVDAFTRYAASAIAANTVLRSLLGSLLPLCGLKMYNKLGLGWGNSLLGFLALALVPIPLLFAIYGSWLRKNPRFQVKL